jgi:hypothetical protein
MSPSRETNTPESSPEGFAAPVCSATSRSAIMISWVQPTAPNGRITEYRIQRGNESTTSSVGLALTFTEISLEPYTVYDFRVLACTNAGETEDNVH